MYEIRVSKIINAPRKAIYDVIADYHIGHNAILPRPFFSDIVVEEGGYGDGSLISFDITLGGQTVPYRQRVSELENGRIIQEANVHDEGITQFILDPIGDGTKTEVTIYVQLVEPTGIFAFLERWITIAFSRWLFNKELNNLAEYVATQQTEIATA